MHVRRLYLPYLDRRMLPNAASVLGKQPLASRGQCMCVTPSESIALMHHTAQYLIGSHHFHHSHLGQPKVRQLALLYFHLLRPLRYTQ